MRQDNNNKGGVQLVAQISDPGMIGGNAAFPLQFKVSGSAGVFTGAKLVYEVRGNFVSVV